MGSIRKEAKSIQDLAVSVKASDTGAFNILYQRLWEPMFVYAQSILMDEDRSKDILQSVWIDYWQRREEIDPAHIKAYLYKATRWQCYKSLRDRKFNAVQLEAAQALDMSAEAEQQHDLDAAEALLKDSLKSLTDRCREIFILSRIHGFSNEEIAQRLQISKRGVENQISTALRKLRKDFSGIRLFNLLLGL